MSARMPVRVKSLVAQIVEILSGRIKSRLYPPDSQIPPEWQLATEFGVSRATIRSAIGVLVERNLVFKRRGVGTFVMSVNQLNNPLHEAEDFGYMIRKNGLVPSVHFVDVQVVEPEERIANALQLNPTEQVLQSYKIFLADGEPVIYCKNRIPVAILGQSLAQQAVDDPTMTESLFDFLENQCDQHTAYQITHLRVEIAANCAFPTFPYDANVPVLVLEDTGYNASDQPIWHSVSFLPNNRMRLELVRPRVRGLAS
ncbi:MAG: GntR family transcriptional regulator [Ardenticatenaceae bacterium]